MAVRLAIKQAEGPDLGKPASQKRVSLLACPLDTKYIYTILVEIRSSREIFSVVVNDF